MRNFLVSLGVTGAIVGVAIYHAVKTSQQNQRDMESEEEIRKKAAAKFNDYNSVLMSCQLATVIQHEGIGKKDIRVTAAVGRLRDVTNDEIMHKIFSFCEVSDLLRIREVCRNWREYIDVMLHDKNYLRACANAGFNNKHRGKYWLLLSGCGIDATLENTLVKYCAYDDRVGYVQGMNFLVGKIIRHMNENEAFSFLRTLMFEYDLRSLYFKNLPRMQIHLYQLDFFIGQFLPKLQRHLIKLKLKLGMFASEWFLTIFTYNFHDYFSDSSFEKCLKILKKMDISEAETESLIERAYVLNIKFADLDLLHRQFIDTKLYLRI